MPHVFLAKNYMRVKGAKEAGFIQLTQKSVEDKSKPKRIPLEVQPIIHTYGMPHTTVGKIQNGEV